MVPLPAWGGPQVVLEDKERPVLQLGRDESPYPIPIVKKGKGWRFDPSEGHEDLLSRRISKAELSALDVVLAYVDAQRQYFRQDHDGDGVLEYAQRFRSSPGRHDGLYWEGKPGEAPKDGCVWKQDDGFRPRHQLDQGPAELKEIKGGGK